MLEEKYKAPWYVNNWLLLLMLIGSFFLGYYGLILVGYIVIVLPKKRKDEEEFYEKKREYEKRRIIRKAKENARNIERESRDVAEETVRVAIQEKEEIMEIAREKVEEVKVELIQYKKELRDCEEELDYIKEKIEGAVESRLKAEERLREAEKGAKKAEERLEELKSIIKGIIRLDKELPGIIEGEGLRRELREYSDYYGGIVGDDPTVYVNLNYLKEPHLVQRMTATKRELDRVYNRYSAEFMRNENWELYMAIMLGLKAEVQLLLTKIKGERYDEGIEDLKRITDKYIKLATNSEDNDVGKIALFIFEVEPLLVNMVEIEKSVGKSIG